MDLKFRRMIVFVDISHALKIISVQKIKGTYY